MGGLLLLVAGLVSIVAGLLRLSLLLVNSSAAEDELVILFLELVQILDILFVLLLQVLLFRYFILQLFFVFLLLLVEVLFLLLDFPVLHGHQRDQVVVLINLLFQLQLQLPLRRDQLAALVFIQLFILAPIHFQILLSRSQLLLYQGLLFGQPLNISLQLANFFFMVLYLPLLGSYRLPLLVVQLFLLFEFVDKSDVPLF